MIKTLEITLNIGCPNKCIYCPQDKLLKAYNGERVMSNFQFQSILHNTPKDVQIDFTGFCEPFLNANASQMMKNTILRGHQTVLYTTLEGFDDVDVLFLKGLTFREVVFHEYEGKNFDKDDFERKKQLFKDNIHSVYTRDILLEEKFRLSRAGNLYDTPHRIGQFYCAWAGKDFSRNVVFPNGDVYLCCMDYSLKHKIGNLYDQKYDDLDRKTIIDMSHQEDSGIICRNCEIACYI